MRRIVSLSLVLLFALTTATFAHTINNNITNSLNDKNEYGVGADIILHEGAEGELLNKAHTEYRFDWNNDEGNHKVYLVGTSKLADIWAKAKALFNKGE